MIREIDELMVHWGEQSRRFGLGGGLGSQMGSIIEWGGAPPRGTPGSRILDGAGIGMDMIAAEVEAAVAELKRKGFDGLEKLAVYRYCALASVREQMRVVGIPEGADRTYRNWVHRLHQQVMLILVIRSGTTRGHTGRRHEGDYCKVTNQGARRARL